MHVLFFSIKRVHLQTLKVIRALLRDDWLTPARFDMMRVIELHADSGIAQGKLRALLGVSAATVSRMVSSLQALGLVDRTRSSRDGRARVVRITRWGLGRTRAARAALVESGIADRLARRGLDLDPDAAEPKLATMRRSLSSMRKAFGCAAAFEHPWTASDLVPYVFQTMVDGRICYGAPLMA